MYFLSYTLLTICGISAGFVTAAAYVAFIAMLGVFPKVAAKTKTAGQCILYENCLILGILIATLLQFFVTTPTEGSPALPLPAIGILILILLGLFGGIYTGFLIGGLSEVLNVIPTYAKITHIQKRISLVIFFLALGKGVALLIQYLVIDML